MVLRVFGAAGLSLAAMVSGALAAAAPVVHDGISVSELQTVLGQAGMQSTPMQTPSGTTYLKALIPGTEVAILLGGIGCDASGPCEGFGAVVWHNQPTTTSLVNNFNQQCCYVRAAIESDGRARLTGEYIAFGGISDKNIIADVKSFIDGMGRYTELRGVGSASLGSKGPSVLAQSGVLADAAKAFTPKDLKKWEPQPLKPKEESLLDRWVSGKRAD